MASPQAPDIFLSYPAAIMHQPEEVTALRKLLDGFHLRTASVDSLSIPRSSKFVEEIEATINQAPIFIACAGAGPLGDWAREELARAPARNRRAVVMLPHSSFETVETISTALGKAPIFDLRQGVDADLAAALVSWCWQQVHPERSNVLEGVVDSLQSDSRATIVAGPPGSGKSTLARLASARLAGAFPFRPNVQLGAGESIEEGLARTVWDAVGSTSEEADLAASNPPSYMDLLAGSQMLVTFDDADLADITDLMPEPPSKALILTSRERLTLPVGTHLFRLHPPPLASSSESKPITPEILAGYRSDMPGGTDLLEIETSVNALCSVIASRQVIPPLSIGLFGRWGAGKSFFIEKMQERIESLAAASQAQPDESDYCPTIHQITFNAWHYADSNLWASLASEIFKGLAETKDELEGLIGQLDSSRLQLEDADSERETAQRHLDEAEADQDRARKESVGVRLELKDLATSAASALDEDEEARQLLNLGGALRELWHGSEVLISLLIVGVVAGVLIAVLLPHLYTTLLGIAIAAGSVVGLVAGPVRIVNRAASEARTRAEEARRRRETELEAELRRLRDAEREAVQRQAIAQREVEEITHAIGDIESGKRLYRFLEEQSRAEAYGPYLGLVALVRRDFERLRKLIEEHEAASADGRGPRQRIVLYVDDLDRCPASRVVEVLEAVHLLLASPLFVVVVAVDARWLVASLCSHYAEEMADELGAPTPHDYLEKIFQIPFSLPEMDDSGFRRLIFSLLPAGEKPPSQTRLREDLEAGTAPEAPAQPLDIDGSSVKVEPEAAWEGTGGAPNLKPEGLQVSTAEIEFMAGLGSLVKTPRAAKRLTNLYRLVRVSLSQSRLEALSGSRDPEFPYLQLLLAIAVGFPSLAPPVFAATHAARHDSSSWWSLVDRLGPPRDRGEQWEEMIVALRAQKTGAYREELATFASWIPVVTRYTYGLQLLTVSESEETQ